MARILVVDDRVENRDFLASVLADHRHDVLQAADGQEALAIAESEHPALIISDLIMPSMDGYALARRLRANQSLRHTPVVFTSALSLDREAQNLIEACGVRFILPKPSEPEQVLRVVADALATVPCVTEVPDLDGQHLRVLTNQLVRKVEELNACNDELQAAKDEAEHANVAKSRFLAAASHDLRQPLQSLLCFSAAMAQHVADDAGRKILEMIDEGLSTLKDLLDRLLDVSRIDSGAIKAEIEAVRPGAIVEQIVASYAPIAARKGLELTVASSCDAVVRTDPHLLGRMVRNLLENAIRYTVAGRVWIECRAESDRLLLSVCDTGIGIPADQQQKIFEEFHQVGNAERDRSQGLGLGLAIVQRLAVLLDHPVEVRSTVGVGSEFSFSLPLEDAQIVHLPLRATVPAPDKAEGSLVVLVDDDPAVLSGLRMVFETWDYDVIAAESPDPAIAALKASGRRPDLVVSDYRLRDGRVGTEVILAIRELVGTDVAAILLTGESGKECQGDAERHDLYLALKPTTPQRLQDAINKLMRRAAE